MSTWSEVHTMTSTTENVSLQESRNGDSLTFDPTVVHSEVANASDEFPQDDHFEFDTDDLKDQLGIDHIMHDLPRHTKTKDLGIQEVQKNIVKSAQPLVQLFDSVLVAQN